jgi:hypothetical protein
MEAIMPNVVPSECAAHRDEVRRRVETLGNNGTLPPIRAAAVQEIPGTSADCPQGSPADADPPASGDSPPDPPAALPFREHYEQLLRDVRARAADISALVAQAPTAESLESFLSARPPEQRREIEEDLLYALVAAQVAVGQAADWLRKMLGAGA